MDPLDPKSFNHRIEILKTGRRYHFVDQIPENYSPRTPTLLCIHGFPDFWYGWRYQIRPWVQRGCRVVVPDMLGYGGTDKPEDASEYTTKKLCNDLSALLDLMEIKRAVVLGHDWGAFTAARFALWHPDRLLALIILSVPYTPPSPVYISVEEVAKLAPDLAYMMFFNNKKSTTIIESELDKFVKFIYKRPGTNAGFNMASLGVKGISNPFKALEIPEEDLILSRQEYDYVLRELQKGMNGPLNYYRTAKFRHDEERDAGLPSNLRIDLPVLFMWGTLDKTTTNSVIAKAHKFVPRIQDMALEGRGHWLMVEAAGDVTEKVISWLEGLMEKPGKGKL
ncbi:epoxide hydrolase [Marasmius fiardii PR-910]|nr:epoxide hydrolase [Marasmius fiardii PR-910]